jgi:hypothetical protein
MNKFLTYIHKIPFITVLVILNLINVDINL